MMETEAGVVEGELMTGAVVVVVVFDLSLVTYEICQELGFRMLCLREGKANPFMRALMFGRRQRP
jgi:hypothetical protein